MSRKSPTNIYRQLAEKAALLAEGKLKQEIPSRPDLLSYKDGRSRKRPKNLPFHQFVELFWSRVIKSDGCWEWSLSSNSRENGKYGNVSFMGSILLTHRVAYILSKGPIPDGHSCMHSCDNPKCCNPNHLSIGTQKDNAIDCAKKLRNRVFYGEDSHCAKLKKNQVMEIRKRYLLGERLSNLSSEFSVSKSAIRYAVKRLTWKFVE